MSHRDGMTRRRAFPMDKSKYAQMDNPISEFAKKTFDARRIATFHRRQGGLELTATADDLSFLRMSEDDLVSGHAPG